MKLRAIRLTNLRRFAGQTAAIEGLGDGLSVIAAPNESGKSTVFDALQALFFVPHGSRARDVASLQPRGGGRVEVAADIDLPDGLFRLEKAFLSRPMARLTDRTTGRVIAQDDAAEAWIAAIAGSGAGGPAGLLWVRQGVTTLDPGSPAERDRLREARRDLMSAVAGEIDQMTGGRRMDRVRAACAAELERLATPTGKPRKGGPWAAAQEEIADLDAEIAGLADRARDLAEALDRRREVAARLARIDRPEARAAREAASAAAALALQAAEDHAARLLAASQEAQLAALSADEAARRHRVLADALAPLPGLAAARDAAATAAAAAEAQMVRAQAAAGEARAAHAAAAAGLARARAAAGAARLAATARETAARRAALAAQLVAAETGERDVAGAEAVIAALPVTPAALAALDRARDALAVARAAAAARAVTLTPDYDGAARIGLDGQDLPGTATAVVRAVTLHLPGIGRLTVDPGEARPDPAAIAAAEAAVDRALAACGAPTPEAARAAMARKTEAEAERRLAAGRLATLAPDGIPVLRAALAAADLALAAARPGPGAGPGPGPGDGPPPAADPETAAAALAGAEAAETAARERLDAAAAAVTALTDPLAGARAARALAETRLAEAEAAAGDPGTRADRLADAAAAAAAAAAQAAAAGDARDGLAAAAPDLATARAEAARAGSAASAAGHEAEALRLEAAELAGLIQAQAELAVEERLAERREVRAALAAREARLASEAGALSRLAAALDEARSAARDAYFWPVQRELAPLLALLAGDAALGFDPDTLLPGTLVRAGDPEPLATLSGGTQEQIAILTRLAFARLFARTGRDVPVILDDALVHSDDARILRMFTALHRVAADQQVIVFTCRSTAFEALGGTRPAFTVSPA
jgi:hypothetical protein